MPTIRISDLAHVLIREYAPRFGRRPKDIAVVVVGPKPGEKLYEELMNEEETRRAVELERYYVVRPAATVHTKACKADYPSLIKGTVARPYNSKNARPMRRTDLRDFIRRNGLADLNIQ